MFSRSAELYDAIYGFKDYPGETARLHELIRERSPGARTLLDIACGTGKHLALLREHYDVEGLDLDDKLLDVARSRLPGVPLHQADMLDFDLGRPFDVVVNLFSSIGYAWTVENLRRAADAMARHLAPRGVAFVEPWVFPERWQPGHVHAVFVDEPELKVARINCGGVAGDTVTIEFHYLVGTPAGVDYFTEEHELGMFSHDDYAGALEAVGLTVEWDEEGLMGRGLYVGHGA